MQGLTVSFVSLLNFHSTFRGYPLAPHSKVRSSLNFFKTVFLSLLSNHGVTGIIMIIKKIVVLNTKTIIMMMMMMKMIMLMAILILLTTANDTNDMTTNHNNQL